MTIDLVRAELRHTLELSAALGRRSDTFRPHCSKLSLGTLELITAFSQLHVPPGKVQSALVGIRAVNQALAKAAVELDPDSPGAVERDVAGVLPILEELRRGMSHHPAG